jgi:xanthine dehydrogenase YagT iron-sulfur-binding subunit
VEAPRGIKLNRRTFVGASVALGGAAAVGTVIAIRGDSDERTDESQASTVHLRINGDQREITVGLTLPSLITCPSRTSRNGRVV